MATKPFEVIAHTADIAVLIRGRNLAELLVHSAQALYAVALSGSPAGDVVERMIVLDSVDADTMVVDWLNELIYLLDAEGLAFSRFEFLELSPCRVVARCGGEEPESARRLRRRDVKAATYHMARLRQAGAGYECRIIFDV